MTFEPPLCAYCGDPVDPGHPGNYRRIRGWVQVRTGGGGHAIRLPDPPDAFAHGYCLDRAARGATFEQTELPV